MRLYFGLSAMSIFAVNFWYVLSALGLVHLSSISGEELETKFIVNSPKY